MKERAANLVSYIFHPLWMPLLTLSVIYFADPFLGLHPKVFRLLLMIFLVNLIAPGLSILLMRYRNIVSNLDITRRKERFLPFMLFLFYYGISYFWLRYHAQDLYIPTIVLSVMSALLVSLLLSTVITFATKISMHLLAMGGICGVLAAVNKIHLLGIIEFVALGILLAGLVGWARITLRVHTHAQVYMGFSLGFLMHFAFINLGVYL